MNQKTDTTNKLSPILSFYDGIIIFMTGATGFLGMCILQKLLYECEGIKRIYVLIKPKNGQTPDERLKKMLKNSSFDRIRTKGSDILKKVITVDGELKEEGLGISKENLQILQKDVSVVFHVAASINLRLLLADAFKINTKGTENVVNICKGMKQLTAFVYVSTAYCHSNRPTIEEKVYKSDIPLDVMYYIGENLEKYLVKNILDGKPNTYAVSKSVAEELISNELKNVAIIRPSIITTAAKDPEPGWSYKWSGGIEAITAMGTGATKCWLADSDTVCDVIPVDMVSNLIIASAWDVRKREIADPNKKIVKVFQCCSGLQKPISSYKLFKTFEHYSKIHLSRKGYLPFDLILVKNRTLYNILFFFLQTVPAYVFTIFEYISLRTPRILQAHRHISFLGGLFNFFNLNQFLFIDYNVRKLYDQMDKVDQQIFDFDVKKLDWERYIEDFVLGVKKYLLKET